MPTNDQNQGLRDDLRAIGRSLDSNQQTLTQRLDDIDRRQQAQTVAFNTAITDLRKELMNMFVAKQEYEPRHAILIERLDKIDKTIDGGRPLIEEFIMLKAKVAQNDLDLEELHKYNSGMGSRVVGFIAVGVSLLGLLLNVLQHVQIR